MTKALAAMLLAIAVPSKAYVPTSDYHEERIEGFTVLISPEAAGHPTWLQKLRDELRDQLSSHLETQKCAVASTAQCKAEAKYRTPSFSTE